MRSATLNIPLGIDTNSNTIHCDIPSFPHLLIGGTTGSGKSSFLNTMICSLLTKNTPDNLMFFMIDTKLVELTQYEDIPHLLAPVCTDAYAAVENLQALVRVMEERYIMTQEYKTRSLEELNSKLPEDENLPYILVVCDEIADLMMLSKKEIEESIVRIAQKARAVGIHLVLATQSPRREVISGLLKANLPSRLCFSVASALDSRIVLDRSGGNDLLGAGDALWSPEGRTPIRVQCPLIETEEIENLVDFWVRQNKEILV